MSFPDIKEIEIQKHHFDRLKENRKSVSYNKAIQIAKMIILNYSPDIRSGQENMLTLLFDMNKLWEEYVYRMLLRIKRSDLSINFQNRQNFWESRTIRPDLVLSWNNQGTDEVFIVDTKWKVLTDNKPSDDDLKQMFSYNIYWNARRSMLLYPNSVSQNETFGNYWKGRETKPHEIENDIDYDRTNQCKVGFINVLNENNDLDFDIGNKIIEKLML
jgi:5-methylcytosine-specific restriction enzyme subunit McrC